jgi:hypothetical protein
MDQRRTLAGPNCAPVQVDIQEECFGGCHGHVAQDQHKHMHVEGVLYVSTEMLPKFGQHYTHEVHMNMLRKMYFLNVQLLSHQPHLMHYYYSVDELCTNLPGNISDDTPDANQSPVASSHVCCKLCVFISPTVRYTSELAHHCQHWCGLLVHPYRPKVQSSSTLVPQRCRQMPPYCACCRPLPVASSGHFASIVASVTTGTTWSFSDTCMPHHAPHKDIHRVLSHSRLRTVP